MELLAVRADGVDIFFLPDRGRGVDHPFDR